MTLEEFEKAMLAIEPLPDAEFLAKAKELCKPPWFKENFRQIVFSLWWAGFTERNYARCCID